MFQIIHTHHQANYKNKKDTLRVAWVWDLRTSHLQCYIKIHNVDKQPGV